MLEEYSRYSQEATMEASSDCFVAKAWKLLEKHLKTTSCSGRSHRCFPRSLGPCSGSFLQPSINRESRAVAPHSLQYHFYVSLPQTSCYQYIFQFSHFVLQFESLVRNPLTSSPVLSTVILVPSKSCHFQFSLVHPDLGSVQELPSATSLCERQMDSHRFVNSTKA